MNDDLLSYYNRELSTFRNAARDFARANPDVAARLRLDIDGAPDPYVERLLEGAAYLCARVQRKLDDEFPAIAESMLGVLYPHYLAPIPAMAIAQFELDPSQATLFGGYAVAAGTRLETEEVEGEPCEFRTAYPLRLFPLKIADAALLPIASVARSLRAPKAAWAIRLRLSTLAPNVPIGKIDCRAIQFYLAGIAGASRLANLLYEALLTRALDVTIQVDPKKEAVSIGRDALRPIGLDPEHAVLPPNPRTFRGYTMLTEYFAFPEKFRFVELVDAGGALATATGPTADVCIYFADISQDLNAHVRPTAFALGCTPIINLFERRADPFVLTQRRSRYRVVPDARRPRSLEIHSVDRVTASTPDAKMIDIQPFFLAGRGGALGEPRAYWHSERCETGFQDGQRDDGTDVDLVFVDLEFDPTAPGNWTIEAVCTCTNRDWPAKLPAGSGRPLLRQLVAGPTTVRCLTAPTPTLRPAHGRRALWRLISHLNLNHLSLSGGQSGAASLSEILELYDFTNLPDRSLKIRGLRSMRAARQTAMLTQGDMGLCRGTGVELTFDERHFNDSGAYLFFSVLERFLALYCSLNSFTQLTVRSTHGTTEYAWPPRAGDKILL